MIVNWNVLIAIAEIVGAIAVVVSLLYLAREIRLSSRSVEMSALRDTTAQWNEWSNMLASSSDLADIVAKGNRSQADLSAAELLRYGAFVQSFFDNVQSERALVIDHKLDDNLSVLEAIVARRIAIDGFSAWWKKNTDDYDDEFVSWIDQIRKTQ